MGRFNSTTSIPISSHGIHAHQVDCRQLDTGDFFQLVPVHYRHCLQGDKVKLHGSLFGRTNPLLQAAFVTGSYNYRYFFVPYRTVYRGYVDFASGSPHAFSDSTYSNISNARYIDRNRLAEAIVAHSGIVDSATSAANDFVYVDSGGAITYYKYTTIGYQFIKVLNALGFYPTYTSYVAQPQQNCYALLAWIKIYLDWYIPSQYTNNPAFVSMRQLLEDNTSSGLHVNETVLVGALFGCLYSFYQNDVYDHVWDAPTIGGITTGSPNLPVIGMSDPTFQSTNYGDVITSGSPSGVSNNSPYIGATNPSGSTGNRIDLKFLTQYAIDALQALSNLMRRFSLVGSRAVDRFLVSRGQKLDYVVSDRSLRLSDSKYPLHVGDVENNSDTNLGELAGKGIVRSVDASALAVDFDVPEDGVLILVRSIIPDGGLITRNDPFNFYVNFYDFYRGEFERLGMEPVPSECLFNFLNGSNTTAINKVFGWWQRYLGYVVNRNTVVGDFNAPLRGSAQLNQFHSFRDLDSTISASFGGPYHSLNFLNSMIDAPRYDRIFYSANGDNFLTLQNIVGVHKTLIPPLSDSFDWDDDAFNKRVEAIISGSKVD